MFNARRFRFYVLVLLIFSVFSMWVDVSPVSSAHAATKGQGNTLLVSSTYTTTKGQGDTLPVRSAHVAVEGQEYTLPVGVPYYFFPAGNSNRDYHLWIPNGVAQVRGLILTPDYGDDRNIYYSDTLGYRQLAQRLNFGLLQYFVILDGEGNDPLDTKAVKAVADDVYNNALPNFAQQSGHPEIAYANLLPMGLSWGGEAACLMAWARPDRTIAYVPLHYGYNISDIDEDPNNPAALAVPALYEVAQNDEFIPQTAFSDADSIPIALAQNAKGGLQAGYVKLNTQHSQVDRQEFNQQWIETLVSLRLPAEVPLDQPAELKPLDRGSGWLGSLTYHQTFQDNNFLGLQVDGVSIFPYADYTGDMGAVHWFPNETIAHTWQAQMLNG